WIRFGVAAMIAALALPASAALPVPYSQSPGWFFGLPPTAIELKDPADGGIDFLNDPTTLGALPTPQYPAGVYGTIGWGCSGATPKSPFPATPPKFNGTGCANGGAVGIGTTFTDPFGQSGRSALRVSGFSGTL